MSHETDLILFLGFVISVIVVIVLIGYALARTRKTYTPMTTIMKAEALRAEAARDARSLATAPPVTEPEKEEAPVKNIGKVQYYQDTKGKWRWRLVASNGRILCCPGESFASKRNAKDNVRRISNFFCQCDLWDGCC